MEPKKSMASLLGLKTYSFIIHDDGISISKILTEHTGGDYVKSTDIDALIAKLSQPHILQKALKALMFGGDLKLEELLSDKSPEK